MPYHLRDGFYFERLTDGSVKIMVAEADPRDATVFNGPWSREITVPANEWASVVAAVSLHGEHGASYQAALDFHEARTKVGI